MRILMVDDEDLQLLRLENTVKKVITDDSEFLSYNNPVKAFEENKDKKIDIAFLDIEMPVLNGVQLAKKLKVINPKINIIFVTAYNDYAIEAYRMHVSGYVMKPVNEERIKEELDGLRYEIDLKPSKVLQVKCFGNFEIFHNGTPLKFHRQKSKELFAYLVDREGTSVNVNELNAILWEEDKKSYFRNLIADIQNTLKEVGAEDVFVKRYNECFIDPTLIDCDAYEYKKNNPDAIRMYRGEYMIQYSWAYFNGEDDI